MPDVLIVGAGPAGAIAATILARGGASVVVLDRARFPRDKLCGDSVNPGAIAVLRRLGLDHAVGGGLLIDGMRVTSEHVVVDGDYGGGRGRSLMRRDLDAALVRAAVASGAQLEEGVLVDAPLTDAGGRVTGVRVKRGRRAAALHARLVIAADGRHSRVARPLGISGSAPHPQRWAVGAYYEAVDRLCARGEMHVRAGYYVGVAPVPGGLANACVVTADRRALSDPGALLARVLRTDRRLGPRFASARQVSAPVCLGPLAVEASAAGVPGLLLAGDAAGFVDPMTGDGLRFAFQGGELAAVEGLHALEHGIEDAHLRLQQARRQAFAAKCRFNRTLRSLVSSPASISAAAWAATIAPGLLRRIIRYAGDLQIPA
ncbi:MAG: NAD(P)/FAD-dependent oxidoreductase [Acidobacteria bacterium]|nr:NAD(P)/FAD-dependent oxidoreductase [Acidobacteriota bacterium]